MLLEVYHIKMKYPPAGSELDDEDNDQFKKYRDDIGDNVATIALMLQGDCQARLLAFLEQSLTGTKSWQGAESALNALQSSSETLNTAELEHTPKLFTHYLQQLPDHPLVYKKALLCIGAHSEWLANTSHFSSGRGRSGQPVVPSQIKVTCLEIAIPFVMRGKWQCIHWLALLLLLPFPFSLFPFPFSASLLCSFHCIILAKAGLYQNDKECADCCSLTHARALSLSLVLSRTRRLRTHKRARKQL